ncbi:Cellulose synthase-like protein G1 [Camellia lanceoleosa]|uniref:Cellulose synthase-like protein G1 n=1 Tax=Camellia lanceoleosa TaxID=1840588 RepID=A0ACC0HEH8_9ERIC|nr:Cellulose synthase-like protein G1 [Camellia lanceoleosa]
MEVMNTVLSAMALDYPAEKLAVYLSDDGGSPLTLYAVKEACLFGRRYGIKTRCPERYFESLGDDDERVVWSDQFKVEEEEIKKGERVLEINWKTALARVGDQPPLRHQQMPLLVYVSRGKRPSHPHPFKAGALNALLRVSGRMCNGPYVLVLDCDMYCNDPTSARQAMCFHLDPEISRSCFCSINILKCSTMLARMMSMITNQDQLIRCIGLNQFLFMKWQGMDGLRGPLFTGTGYYLKRKALYGTPNQEGIILEFTLDVIVEEAMILAGCTFEKGTKWGKEIGYAYDSLLESTFTGYLLHCKGWRSVYLYPKRPCFLGYTTTDMKDAMIQIMKWCSGLFRVAFSRFSPLTYDMSKMSILQSMCYGSITFAPLHSISFLIYGTIPQLCFFSGIPLYPEKFKWNVILLFSLSFGVSFQPMVCGVCTCICIVALPTFIRGPLYRWLIKDMWNEQRIWIIRCVTSYLFGCLDVLLKRLGITKANFRLTNKAIDQ